MESNILNFPDAMKLAEILTIQGVTPALYGLDFIDKILENISPENFIFLTGLSLEDAEVPKSGDEVLISLHSALQSLDVSSLLSAYIEMGFK